MTVVRWRSGNAAVCKTAMSGFDPHPHLFSLATELQRRDWKQALLKCFFSLKDGLFQSYCFAANAALCKTNEGNALNVRIDGSSLY